MVIDKREARRDGDAAKEDEPWDARRIFVKRICVTANGSTYGAPPFLPRVLGPGWNSPSHLTPSSRPCAPPQNNPPRYPKNSKLQSLKRAERRVERKRPRSRQRCRHGRQTQRCAGREVSSIRKNTSTTRRMERISQSTMTQRVWNAGNF